MFPPVAQRSSFHILVAITLSFSLLLMPTVFSSVSEATPDQGARAGKPRREKPEGELPDLEEVQRESLHEREAPPPIHSTVRSPKVPLEPWNGRRVGDSEPPPKTEQTEPLPQPAGARVRRAHARRRFNPSPPVLDDQFIQNFFTWALLRSPNATEATYWKDQFRVAYAHGQTSVKLAAVEFGKTIFESAEYAARNRDNHWYVYDLYKTFLMRDPDASGWANWESMVPINGRVNVRRAFEEAPEFATILAGIVPNGSPTANAASLITALVEPRNQAGYGMLARDAKWGVSLLSLPGRNGLDLGLGLSYSSMVWTRSGPYLHFDENNGFPSPGFRLGFPSVQRRVFNAQTAKNAYLMITASGRRVELRQVGTTNVYEAADSSYLQLTDNSPNLLLRATDGTQLSFTEIDNEYRCTQVKDRNGNYISVGRNGLGQLTSVTDTAGRIINFNYDGNANLISITQAWNGQPSHQWVSFGWGTRNMQPGFTSGAIVGTAIGQALPVVTQVALNDTSHFTFDYTDGLQVSVIRNNFGAIERNATYFTYETPAGDVPRLLDSRVSARNWTNVNGVPAQVITTYSVAGDSACVTTAPDGTIYKEYYGTGWQKGLTTLSEVWSGGVRQKWIATAWTQDNTSIAYQLNPRVMETNVYDVSGNRRRTVIDYGAYALWSLPYAVKEYAADGVTEIRRIVTDYNLSQAYLDRRIIGLVSQVMLTNGSSNQGKITYDYDDPARLLALPATPIRHDSTYNTSFTARGNVTSVSRWDFTDINNAAKKLTSYTNYSVAGTPLSTTDPAGHQNSYSYADSFFDGVNRNTFAYLTTITDADGFSSFAQYNYDFGAATRTQSPAPAGQSQGAIQTMTYDSLGQLERVTTNNNGAYRRFWYGADFVASYATVNNVADELYSIEVVDGVGRVIGAAGNHPGSTGGYRLVSTIYDHLGQVKKRSNPTEVNSSWVPSGDDAAGMYSTQQTYDWQGRPLVTTNQDGTTNTAAYSGCGCAGGAVLTLTDEGTLDGGVAKRRQQKIYSDVLGRTVKTEILNWQGGSVYSATVNTYNVRNQVTQIRQYAGAEGSGTYQDTTMTYDGYGRPKIQHLPEQNAGANTVFTYNADGTINTITDGRGAVATYGYNSRHLPTSITHSLSGSLTLVESFAYDAVGNRTSMSGSSGSTSYQYNQLSRLTSETHQFNGLAGPFLLTYQYNLAGQLTNLTYPGFNTGYTYDAIGRTKTVTGPPRWIGITQYVSDIQYRASDSYKTVSYGSAASVAVTYNPRLQLQSYKMSSLYNNQWYDSVYIEAQYFADGSVRTAQDLYDPRFTRTYSFDHVGSMSQASSGVYNQTFQHDAFGNTTNRQSIIWTEFDSFVATWINGRNQNQMWQYDANGTVRFDDDFEYAYDAKGLNLKVRNLRDNLWISQTANAEGLMTKRSTGSSTATFSTTYYLRSTVLGGKVVAEYNSAAQQQKRYAYLDGQLLATDDANNFFLEHKNPLTGSRGQSFSNGIGGSSYAIAEPDSSGVVDVGFSDPNDVPPLPPEEPDIASILGGLSGKCRVQGIQSTFGCHLAQRMLAGKTALRCPNDDCDARLMTITQTTGGKLAATSKFFVTAGDPGWDGSLDGTYGWFPPLSNKIDLNDPNQAKRIASQVPDLLKREYLTRVGSQHSQNTGLDLAITDLVNKVLAQPACIEFARTVIDTVSKKNAAIGSPADVFKAFLNQGKPHALITRNNPPGGGGHGSPVGQINDGTAAVFSPIKSSSAATQIKIDADTVIAELFHMARADGYYSDEQLAKAVNSSKYAADAPKVIGPEANIFDKRYQAGDWDKNKGYSVYFHYIQYLHCTAIPENVRRIR